MIQRSQNKNNSGSNRNENYIVEDIREIVSILNTSGGDTTSSILLNGFRNVGCLSGNITLPDNSTLEYDSPLEICTGSSITIPANTTLSIV